MGPTVYSILSYCLTVSLSVFSQENMRRRGMRRMAGKKKPLHLCSPDSGMAAHR